MTYLFYLQQVASTMHMDTGHVEMKQKRGAQSVPLSSCSRFKSLPARVLWGRLDVAVCRNFALALADRLDRIEYVSRSIGEVRQAIGSGIDAYADKTLLRQNQIRFASRENDRVDLVGPPCVREAKKC